MDDSMGSEMGGQSNGLTAGDDVSPCLFARDDRQAFEEIVAAYRQRVSRLAYRLLGWDQDIEDVVQDVFVAVLKDMRKFRGESSFWTWLATITVNRCRSLGRRRLVRMKFLSDLLHRRAPGSAGPADDAERRETLDRVRRAVRALPGRLREAAVLRFLEEMSIEEIAGVVGASPNAVQVRLHRARALLRDKLADLVEEGTK